MDSKLIRARRDSIGGVLLAGIGLFVEIYTLSHYELGAFSRMGPGMVPALLGGLLIIFGGIIFLSSLRGEGDSIEVDFRAVLAIGLGAASFAFVLEAFGLFLAIVIMSLATTMFETKLAWPNRVALAFALATLAVVIFRLALGMHISVARWPL